MSQEIYFDGVKYISASDAASIAALTRDYVARLCKERRILGKRIGKQWYVNLDSLQTFILTQKYAHAKRREKLIEARKQEYRTGEGPEKIFATTGAGGEKGRTVQKVHQAMSAEGALRSALARLPVHVHARAPHLITSVPLHAIPSKGHIYLHALPPALEFLHKFVAVVVAVLFTVGTYLLVDAEYARSAERSSTLSASLMKAAQEQLAAAAENPTSAFADTFRYLAKTLNHRVDSLVYGVMFPRSLIEGSSGRIVSVRVVSSPSASRSYATQSGGRPSGYAPVAPRAVVTQLPPVSPPSVIERVIETQRIVSTAGGITEEILNARLNQLDNKLTSQIYAITSVSSPPASGGFTHTIALTNRIDQLSSVDISNSTFTGGSISNSSVAATTLTASSASVGSLSVTGAGTSTFANGIDLADGCLAVDGTCITGSGGSGTPGGSDTQVQFNDNGSFSASANFTFSSSTNKLSVTNASSSLLSAYGGLYVGSAATTSIFGAGNSTFGAGVQTSYLNVTGTTATSTFA